MCQGACRAREAEFAPCIGQLRPPPPAKPDPPAPAAGEESGRAEDLPTRVAYTTNMIAYTCA